MARRTIPLSGFANGWLEVSTPTRVVSCPDTVRQAPDFARDDRANQYCTNTAGDLPHMQYIRDHFKELMTGFLNVAWPVAVPGDLPSSIQQASKSQPYPGAFVVKLVSMNIGGMVLQMPQLVYEKGQPLKTPIGQLLSTRDLKFANGGDLLAVVPVLK